MELTKNQTKQLQGIAILCMLGLHLFNRSDISSFYDVSLYIGSVPLLTIISYSFDACVPIYLFCSGYGLYKTYNKNHNTYFESNKKRVFQLLIRFWLILCITCLVGYLLGMKDVYPGSLLNFIENVLLIKSSYVGAFWFIQTYVLLVITSKYIFKVIEKIDYRVLIFISFVLYGVAFIIERKIMVLSMPALMNTVMNAFMLYLRSQFAFVIGGIFASKPIIKERKINNWIAAMIVVLIICIRGFVLQSMVFAPFSAILLYT